MMRAVLTCLLILAVLAHCVLGCSWHSAWACAVAPQENEDSKLKLADDHAGPCHGHRHACGHEQAKQIKVAGPTVTDEPRGPMDKCPADCPCQHECPGVGAYLDSSKVCIEIVLDAALHALAAVGSGSFDDPNDLVDYRGEAPAPIPILPVRLHLAHQVLLI